MAGGLRGDRQRLAVPQPGRRTVVVSVWHRQIGGGRRAGPDGSSGFRLGRAFSRRRCLRRRWLGIEGSHGDDRRGSRRHGGAGQGRRGRGSPERHRRAAGVGQLQGRPREVQGEVPQHQGRRAGAGLQQPGGDRRPQQPEGHGQGARRPRPRPSVALANTALFAPYQVAAWADIPDNLKESTGLWVSDYAGFTSIGCDANKVPAPATVADMLKPEYKGMIALNGNPKAAAAGLHGVVMAALANGGSADDIAAGREVLQRPQRGRQPAAGRPDPGHDRLRPDAVRHRLGVQQRRPDRGPRRPRASTGRSASRRTPRRWPRTTTRPSTRTPRIRRPRGCGRSSCTRPRPRTSG